jgi:hypothetical protein
VVDGTQPVDSPPAQGAERDGARTIDVAPESSTSAADGSDGRATSGRLAELEHEMVTILDDASATERVPPNLRPSLLDASRDTAQVYRDGCISLGDNAEVLDCRYGAVGGRTKILLFGDSHAAQWFPAMEAIATARDAELIVILKGGCPVADVPSTRVDLVESCPRWREAAIARAREIEPDMVVTSSLSGYTTDEQRWETGLAEVLGRMSPATDHVVVLLDTPRAAGSPPVCLSDNLESADHCVAERADAVRSERAVAERGAAAAVGATVIDPVPWLCGRTRCPVIVGDALMYRDVDHITTVASLLLAPLLDAALFP